MKDRARYWPSWWLRFVLERTWLRGLWAEAWIEWHRREVLEVADEAVDESGPWLVQPPRGMH